VPPAPPLPSAVASDSAKAAPEKTEDRQPATDEHTSAG
jgi:hypothetical protein